MRPAMERPMTAVTSALCWSYTDAERQHLFRVCRLFITCYYAYVSYYGMFVLDMSNFDHPVLVKLGADSWWWKCASVWNLVLQVSYFIYCTVFVDSANSGLGKNWMKPRLKLLKKIRDFLFISLVFPLTISVCGFFWAVSVVDKPLLFPDKMERWVPDWFNHAVHTNPIVFTLFDLATANHRLPAMAASTAGLFALSGSYVTCLLYNKFVTGNWVYLIIEEIATSFTEVFMYFAVAFFIIPFLCMTIGYKLCSWFSSSLAKEEHKIS